MTTLNEKVMKWPIINVVLLLPHTCISNSGHYLLFLSTHPFTCCDYVAISTFPRPLKTRKELHYSEREIATSSCSSPVFIIFNSSPVYLKVKWISCTQSQHLDNLFSPPTFKLEVFCVRRNGWFWYTEIFLCLSSCEFCTHYCFS